MKTTIDYLAFRSKGDPREVLEALKPMMGALGSSMTIKSLPRGAMGFQQAVEIGVSNLPFARLDFGGESQRGWVRTVIKGQGCEWVDDWDALEELEKLPCSEVRRLDIALTTWNGEITHDTVVNAHGAGQFETGGRPPALRQITSSDPRDGRTCYVGKREKSLKFFRAYEKGFQMLQGIRLPGTCTHIDDHLVEDIYRCEVELKATGDSLPIGWDVIERRDEYFAGSYPFCAQVLPGVEADILMRRKERKPQMDLAAALNNCFIQFGPTLFTALAAYHGDMTAVWDKVIAKHHCQSLLEAGVLLVDHD